MEERIYFKEGKRIFLGQQKWRKKKSKWSILQIVFGALAILGIALLLASGFIGWLLPGPAVINWPLCIGGLGLTIFCSVILKKV